MDAIIENPIFIATAALTEMGFVCAVLLALFEKKFGVKTDEDTARAEAALPGVNCGGCGYPSCLGYAEAVAHHGAPLNLCGPGGQSTADALAKITGRDAGKAEAVMAFIRCGGDLLSAKRKSDYNGIAECAVANSVAGGWKECAYGCLGFGTCARICQYGAIDIVDGIAVVNPVLCTGCGVCVAKCPRSLIAIVPKAHRIHVRCNSPEKGAAVIKVCSRGCIGCGICVKLEGGKSLKMNGYLATVDYTQAPVENDAVVAKCPKKCIVESYC